VKFLVSYLVTEEACTGHMRGKHATEIITFRQMEEKQGKKKQARISYVSKALTTDF
jgi:hypothetical protein